MNALRLTLQFLAFCCFVAFGAKAFATERSAELLEAISVEIATQLQVGYGQFEKATNKAAPEVVPTLNEFWSGSDYRYYGLSVKSSLSILYDLAELKKRGEGKRLLAKYYVSLKTGSAQVAENIFLRNEFRDFSAAELSSPIEIASVKELPVEHQVKLPNRIEKAIDLLSDYITSQEGIGRIRRASLRSLNLKNPSPVWLGSFFQSENSTFDKLLATSASRRDLLQKLFISHGAPPRLEVAMRNFMSEVQSSSSSLQVDQRFQELTNELNRHIELVEIFEDVKEELKSQTEKISKRRVSSLFSVSVDANRVRQSAENSLSQAIQQAESEPSRHAGSERGLRLGNAREEQPRKSLDIQIEKIQPNHNGHIKLELENGRSITLLPGMPGYPDPSLSWSAQKQLMWENAKRQLMRETAGVWRRQSGLLELESEHERVKRAEEIALAKANAEIQVLKGQKNQESAGLLVEEFINQAFEEIWQLDPDVKLRILSSLRRVILESEKSRTRILQGANDSLLLDVMKQLMEHDVRLESVTNPERLARTHYDLAHAEAVAAAISSLAVAKRTKLQAKINRTKNSMGIRQRSIENLQSGRSNYNQRYKPPTVRR